MADLKNPAVIWAKGLLFLLLGLLGAVLVVLEAPSVTIVVLLLLTVWAFCRFYYFAFYVIEHYVDSTYRFAGLLSFLQYAIHKRHERATGGPTGNPVGVSADPPDDASDSQPPQAPVSN